MMVEFLPSLSAAGLSLWHRGGGDATPGSMATGAEVHRGPFCRVSLGVAPDCLSSNSVTLLPTESPDTQGPFHHTLSASSSRGWLETRSHREPGLQAHTAL